MSDAFDRTGAGPAVAEVDRLLRDFYQSETPDPWPRLALPRRTVVRPARRPFFRLALAASVALALVGYWSVAGLFPGASKGGLQQGPEIGLRERPVHKKETPPEKKVDDATAQPAPMPIVGPSGAKGMR